MDGQIRCGQNKEKTGISKAKAKIADVHTAGHQIGRDSTFAQQKRQNVENAKEAITKRCADQ